MRSYAANVKSGDINETSGIIDWRALLPPAPAGGWTPQSFFDAVVARTLEACVRGESYPQGTTEWLRERMFCITASQFGAAIGQGFVPGEAGILELLRDKLAGGIAKTVQMAWGSAMERLAMEAYAEWLRAHEPGAEILEATGLCKHPESPWKGVSPDGIVKIRKADGSTAFRLVEFKCPFFLSHVRGKHPYGKHSDFIAPYYYSQIQGIMGSFRDAGRDQPMLECDFVVWQPQRIWVTRVPFDAKYYDDTLLPGLRTFYFDRLLPAFVRAANDAGSAKPEASDAMDV